MTYGHMRVKSLWPKNEEIVVVPLNGVPVAKARRQTAPFATVLRHIQDGVEDLKVGKAHIAPLGREAMHNSSILGFADFHKRILPDIVLTRPSLIGLTGLVRYRKAT